MHCNIFHNKSENNLSDLGPFIYLVNINCHTICDFSQNIFFKTKKKQQSELFKYCGFLIIFFLLYIFLFWFYFQLSSENIDLWPHACVKKVVGLFFDRNINL